MYLDTHGSGGMGASMLRVSLRLVWPFTLIVSYLCNNNCHNLALAVKMREREGTQTRCLATSVEKCLIMPPGSSAANIITIKEEEHEEG